MIRTPLFTLGIFALSLTGLSAPTTAYADNIAACEIVVMRTIIGETQDREDDNVPTEANTSSKIATFIPATDFMISLYDEDPDYMKEVDGFPISGVFCERKNVIPSLRDYTILDTGFMLALSRNFNSSDAATLSIINEDGKFVPQYSGPDMSDDDKAVLSDRIDIFNLQAELKRAEQKELELELELGLEPELEPEPELDPQLEPEPELEPELKETKNDKD